MLAHESQLSPVEVVSGRLKPDLGKIKTDGFCFQVHGLPLGVTLAARREDGELWPQTLTIYQGRGHRIT